MFSHANDAMAGVGGTGHARSVFVTNDALSGHIGTAQILPYLEGLAARGHILESLSVETRVNDWDREGAWRKRLEVAAIRYYPLRRSAGPLYKLERFLLPSRLARALEQSIAGARPDLIHCRSYMPLKAVLEASARHRIPFLFDMRGFWIDQRIEGGFWNMDRLIWQQVVKWLRATESRAISEASAIVTLTADARDIVSSRPDYNGAPISVIPCSVRGDIFRPLSGKPDRRSRLGIPAQSRVIAYLGSAGGLYRLDVLYRLWQSMTERGVQTSLLFIGDHQFASHAEAAAQVGVVLDPRLCFFVRCAHHEVPGMLATADVGISPIIQNFSSLGVSATKVGEYLSCGLPVVTNAGVGDARRIITDGENGFVLPDFGDDAIAQCTAAVIAGLDGGFLPPQEISRRAGTYFRMDHAISAYDAIYRNFVSESRT